MTKKMKSLRMVMAFTLIIAALSAFFIIKNYKDKNPGNVTFSGTVEADELNASSEISGKIKDIRVEEGKKVKKGDIIAVIDSEENTIKMQQADISLKNAQNELGKVTDGNRSEDIEAQRNVVEQGKALVNQGEAAVKTAQNNLDNAKKNYDYRKKTYDNEAALNKGGYESDTNLDAAKNSLDSASNSLLNAESALENANAQLNGYEAQLSASTEKLNLLVNGATEKTKNTAQYGIDQANTSYELSKLTLDKSNIVAASDGIIETINFKNGEYVSPGSPIATLMDDKNLYVKIYIPEKNLTSVKLNEKVEMKSDFLKGKTVNGVVTFISPKAEFTPMNIVTKEDRMKLVYEVKIKICDNLDDVRSGMLLDVSLK